MQKHLFVYATVCGALVLGILICLGLMAHMLLTRPPQAAFYTGAEFVKEVAAHVL